MGLLWQELYYDFHDLNFQDFIYADHCMMIAICTPDQAEVLVEFVNRFIKHFGIEFDVNTALVLATDKVMYDPADDIINDDLFNL